MITTLLITEDETLVKELRESLADGNFKLEVSTTTDIASIKDADILIVDSRYINSKLEIDKPLIALVIDEVISDDNLSLFDDLIFAPIDSEELSIRIRRLLLRSEEMSSLNKIKIDDMLIDLDSYEVRIENQRIALTFKEYELLKYLASNRGRAFDREALLTQIWNYDYYGGTRTVDVHVRRLRAKLGTKYGSMIETVRQVGYRFCR